MALSDRSGCRQYEDARDRIITAFRRHRAERVSTVIGYPSGDDASFEAVPGDQVHLAAEEVCQVQHQPGVVQQSGLGRGKEFNGQINVAATCRSMDRRTKDGELPPE